MLPIEILKSYYAPYSALLNSIGSIDENMMVSVEFTMYDVLVTSYSSTVRGTWYVRYARTVRVQ